MIILIIKKAKERKYNVIILSLNIYIYNLIIYNFDDS